jgi:hypothetical protein
MGGASPGAENFTLDVVGRCSSEGQGTIFYSTHGLILQRSNHDQPSQAVIAWEGDEAACKILDEWRCQGAVRFEI